MRRILYLIIATAMFAITACDKSDSNNKIPDPVEEQTQEEGRDRPIPTPLVLTENDKTNLTNFNQFSTELFKSLAQNDDKNIIISPLSVATVFAMSANGDCGETRDKILKALGFDSGTEGLMSLNKFCATMLTQLPKADNVTTLVFANSAWVDTNLSFTPEFKDAATTYYQTDVFNAPISKKEGIDMINGWISTKTNGMITDLVKQTLEKAALANTVYFRGDWCDKFSEENTSSEVFYNLNNEKSKSDFMHQTQDLDAYIGEDGTKAVTLYYGARTFAMTLITPDSDADFESFVEGASYEYIKNILDNSKGKSVSLSIPKFQSETKINLNNLAKVIGSDTTGSLQYNNLLMDDNFEATSVIHGAKIELDEKGTIAAGASVIRLYTMGNSDGQPEIIPIVFDHPFIYLIHEKSSGAILFMGAVKNL